MVYGSGWSDNMEEFCCHFCGKSWAQDLFRTFCRDCGEPLLCKETVGQKEIHWEQSNPLRRYIDFLPLREIFPALDLGTGDTPLLTCPSLAEQLHLPRLYAKNESQNPTGSFKDRGTLVAVQKAHQSGISRIGTVSTGNMAASTAAFGARAGLRTFVLVKEDTGKEKLLSSAAYGPRIMRVRGDYGKLFRHSYEIGINKNIYFINSVDPMRLEGYKVTAFEIYAQMSCAAPDFVFVPVSAGGHIIGLMRAFLNLREMGHIASSPTFIGIQAEGCSPIVQAYEKGLDRVERLSGADTIAQAISNPDPPGGNIVLDMIRSGGGSLLSVSDREILSAQGQLAGQEGLFVLPASATTLAGLIKYHRNNPIGPDKSCVLILTGSGLKGLSNFSGSLGALPCYELSEIEAGIE
jgi:threonine synthase